MFAFHEKKVSWIFVDFRLTFCRPKNWRSPKKVEKNFQILKPSFLELFYAINIHTNNVRYTLESHKQIYVFFKSTKRYILQSVDLKFKNRFPPHFFEIFHQIWWLQRQNMKSTLSLWLQDYVYSTFWKIWTDKLIVARQAHISLGYRF